MVRTEVKISMKKKYSACLHYTLLKSYPNKYIYSSKKKERKKTKTKEEAENNYGILPSSSIKGLPTDKNV